MQKMLECVEAQVEVLKKIIGHLFEMAKEEIEKDNTDLEQSKLTQEDINRMMVEGSPTYTQL